MRKTASKKVLGKSLDKAVDFKQQIADGGIVTGSGEMPTVGSGDMHRVNDKFDEYEETIMAEHNEKVEEQIEEWSRKQKEVAESIESIKSQFDNVGIKPHGIYILVKPFSNNPFTRLKKLDNGFVVPEFDPHYKSQDTGEIEEMQRMSIFALVMETSPATKVVKKGDIVMYNRHEGVPIPFYNQGFEVVAETHIKCVVANESELEERYESLRKAMGGIE